MALFGLLGPRDPFRDSARKLVPAARTLAVSSFTEFLQRFSFLGHVKLEDWDFFVGVGGVTVALSTLVGRVPEDRFRSLYSLISHDLTKWTPDGERAAVDCREFIDRALSGNSSSGDSPHDPVQPSDAVGMWIVWNLLKRRPEGHEMQLAGALGRLVSSSFSDWWAGR